MDLHPDFRDLLAELVAAKVSFAVVGGYAVGHHAKPRATKDLDVLVAGDEENLARVAIALTKFGAPKTVIDAARMLGPEDIVYFGSPPVRVDILRTIDGVETQDVMRRAVSARIDALEIRVIGFDDLVTNKKAAGRAQDLADVQLLERFRASMP